MTRLSVIIPAHNAVNELERCLSSIIPQLHEHDEIILVEDSSTDGTSELCDIYANEYPFIHTYHVTFKGPSPTRNYGIDKSQGEYILFVDSDDYIEKDTISQMIKYVKDYEMVLCGYYFVSQSQNTPITIEARDVDKRDVFELYETKLLNVLWNKLFHASIIKKHHVYFDVNVSRGEDLLFVLQYLQYIHTPIHVMNECLYYYIRKVTGITTSYKETMDDKRNRMYLTMKEFLKCTNHYSLFVSHMLNLYFRQIRDYLAVHKDYSKIGELLFIKKQARHRVVEDILSYDQSTKIRVLKCLHSLHLDIIMFLINRIFLK